MKGKVLLIAGLVLLAGCKDERIEKAHAAIKERLNDPNSAEFRNDRVVEDKKYPGVSHVCGEVNAKNQMGGYVGFTKYVVSGDDKAMDIVSMEKDAAFSEEYCHQ